MIYRFNRTVHKLVNYTKVSIRVARLRHEGSTVVFHAIVRFKLDFFDIVKFHS